MYSLILMTAMSGSPDTTEFNGFFRDLFSFGGCRGSCRGSCFGSGYGSCSGRSSGCTGSCRGEGFGSRLRASTGCTGRSYSCSGYANGCTGGYLRDIPFPDGLAQPGPATSTFMLPSGCHGHGLTLGTPMPYSDVPFADGLARPSPAEPPASVPEDRTGRRIALSPSGATGRATVLVKLPTDATLYAEGQRLTLTSAERTFVTPPLPLNEDYTYAFRVEYARGGETITQSKKASVRAGSTTTVEFTDLSLAKAQKEPADAKTTSIPLATGAPPAPAPAALASAKPDRARITVKLPPGATLYVDGKKHDRTELVREFATPPLPPGQEFAYQMKAEVVRNGHPETQTTKVSFRAGETVSVDFTAAPVK